MILSRRRVNQSDLKSGRVQPSRPRDPLAANEILNHTYDDIDIDPATESGHQITSAGIDEASADHVYVVIKKKQEQEQCKPDKTRGDDIGADITYDVAFVDRFQCQKPVGATSFRCEAERDTYSHINHAPLYRQHRHDDDGTYDHVMRQNMHEDCVDNTYDKIIL